MINKDITSFRKTVEWLKEQGELLTIKNEVDPIYEVAAIQKALEEGPALLFENTKGYPGIKNLANLLSRLDRTARIFDVTDPRKLKFKCHEAFKNQIPPRIVEGAPCQEVVITDNIDVLGTLPVPKHTERDPVRVFGCGNVLVTGKYFNNGSCISFRRMVFRGKDWGTILAAPASHLGQIFEKHRGEKIPVTINIGTPPAVLLMAAGPGMYIIMPYGTDELAIAGGLQGTPVDIVKAKTVDAYAVANSECVIEGYIDTNERVWETEEAEKAERPGLEPLFPEYPGYLGRAYRVPKFQATAITHRKDPIFYTQPLSHGYETDVLQAAFREVSFYEVAERIVPGFVIDVHTLPGIVVPSHVVYQVKKRNRSDEGRQRAILTSVLGMEAGLKLAIAVDEDIDIYSADDILWAVMTRADPERDFILGGGGLKAGFLPSERADRSGELLEGGFLLRGGLAIDATVPFGAKWRFERPHYPVDKIDLSKWFSEAEIAATRAMQSDYAKVLARMGW